MNILFLVPVLSGPYYHKRIYQILKFEMNCAVYGFERDYFEGEPWKIDVTVLGRIKNRNYFSRIISLFKAVLKIQKAVKKNDLIYAFNLDLLLISWFVTLFQRKKIKLIYDVADIHTILIKKGIVSKLFRATERFLLKHTSLIVVTSPAYIDGYFHGIQNADNQFKVIENKIEKNVPRHLSLISSTDINTNKYITIGYFGGIRCEQSLKFLKKLITESNGTIRLKISGYFLGTQFFKKAFLQSKHSTYSGPFIDPDDLDQLYSSVDLIWTAHMHGITNTKWSISNRFYQACYFRRPMIGQVNTQDAKRIERYKIGCSIDLQKFEESKSIIQSINTQQIEQWKKNLKQVPEEVYSFTNEYEQLVTLMKSTLNEKNKQSFWKLNE